MQPFGYDLAKAKSLLAQGGYPNGFTIKFSASSADKDIVQAIAGQLQKIGVRADVSLLDAATFKQRLVSSNKQALGPMYFTGNTGWTLDAESTCSPSSGTTAGRAAGTTRTLTSSSTPRRARSNRPRASRRSPSSSN